MSNINKQFGKDLIINSTTDAVGGSVGSIVTFGGANIDKKLYLGSSYSAPQLGNTTGAFLTVNDNAIFMDTTSTSTNNTAFWSNFIGNTTIATTNSNVTFGTAGSLYIDGPPVAGTNVTLTNPWSIYLNTGGSYFGGSVSINTTSVTQALSVDGNINFTGNLYQNGSVYSGSTQWGSTGANIYFNAGNVAIGTLTPSQKLDVIGGIRAASFNSITQQGAYLQWNRSGGAGETWLINQRGSGNLDSIRLATAATDGSAVTEWWRFQSNNLYNMVGGNIFIDSSVAGSQFVFGYNTPKHTSLTGTLQVYNNSTDRTLAFQVTSRGTGSGIDSVQITVPLQSTFNSNTVGNIFTTGGNVGIGTASPGAPLDVRVAGDNGNLIAQFGSNSGTSTGRIMFYDQVFPGSAGPRILFAAGNIGVIQGSGNIGLVPTSNVGIGNTSPSITLDVSGSLGMKTSNTNTWDHLYFTHDGSGAFMRAGGVENGLAFELNAASSGSYGSSSYTRVMTLTSSGNVGIGTTSPNTTLDVNGNIRIPFSTSTGSFRLTVLPSDNFIYQNNTIGHYSIMWTIADVYYSLVGGAPMYLTGYGGIRFFTYGSERMTVSPTGNVGIGTTNPGSTLDVVGTGRFTTGVSAGQYLYASNSSGALMLGSDSSAVNPLYSTQMYISGNRTATQNCAGIGLQRSGSRVSSLGLDTNNNMVVTLQNTTDNLYFKSNTSDYNNTTGGNFLMTIQGTGNVGIGTTSPSERLHAVGDIRVDNTGGAYSIYVDPLGIATAGPQLQFTNIGSTAGDFMIIGSYNTINNIDTKNRNFRIFNSAGNTLLYGSTAGNVGIGTTAPNGVLSVFSSSSSASIDIQSGAQSRFWIAQPSGRNILSIGGNGASLPAAGAINIDNAYNVGIGTTSPGATLDVTGTARFTTSVSTASVNATNIVGTTVSAGTLAASAVTAGTINLSGNMNIAGTLNVVNITTTNLIDTNITAANVVGTTVSAGTLRYTNAIGSNGTLGALLVTGGGLAATFNSNTLGSLVTTGGNVGIGTAAPVYTLDVNGQGHLKTSAAANGYSSQLVLEATSGLTESSVTLINGSSGSNWTLSNGGSPGTGQFGIYNWGLARSVLTCTTAGNVGIGTASPANTLQVHNPSASTDVRVILSDATTTVSSSRGLHLIKNGAQNAYLWNYENGVMQFGTNNSAVITITGGNVGIGTAAPANLLHLSTTGTTNGIIIAGGGNNGRLDFSTWNSSFLGSAAGARIQALDNNWSADLLFQNRNIGSDNNTMNTRMIITAAGVIGIGTTQPNTGYTTTIPNARLSLLSGVPGSTAGASRLSIGGDNSHYSAIEGAHTASGSTTLAFMTCTNASTNSANPLTRMFIDANGNVGIGTTSPAAVLNVAGSTIVGRTSITNNMTTSSEYGLGTSTTEGSSRGVICLGNSPNTATNYHMINETWGLTFYRGSYGSGSPVLTLTTAGNVGIGTNSPESRLHVFESSGTVAGANTGSIILDHDNSGGASSITFRSKVNRSSDYAYIQYQDAASVGGAGEAAKFIIGVQNDGDDHIVLDPSGGVGVGTYSPGFKLHVNGNMRADNIYNNGWFRNYGDQGLYNEDYGCNFVRNDAQYGNWRMYGNQVGGWDGIRFTTNEISIMAGNSTNNKQCGFHYNGTGWAMTIDSSRNMFVTGNITAYWSDRRLKTNLQKLDNFDDVLVSLTGYSFNWNEKGQEILQKPSDEIEIGLIAQDVQAVIPQAVTINKAGRRADQTDDDESCDYLTINYDKIVPFLVEGYKAQRTEIQAQRTEIQAQQTEINELKSKIESLENVIQQILNR